MAPREAQALSGVNKEARMPAGSDSRPWRLAIEDVDPGAARAPLVQPRDERLRVDERTACRIDRQCPASHGSELCRAEFACTVDLPLLLRFAPKYARFDRKKRTADAHGPPYSTSTVDERRERGSAMAGRTTAAIRTTTGSGSANLARLAAVRTRNRSYDGTFVYGVTTTGIYCRPSCPSRPARLENMVFFDDETAALRAGLRACRRCRPGDREAPSPVAATVRAICRYITEHADEPLTLALLARRSGYSAAHLQRAFKAEIGISPREYQEAVRVLRLKTALRGGETVTEATATAGFGSSSRLHAAASRRLGMSPSAYRAGGKAETLYYACRHTALGPVMMAATERAVAFLEFGADETELVAKLTAEFPRATLVRSDAERSAALDAWLAAFDAFLAGRTTRPDLPLDIRGTAFQVTVWNFLTSLRDGETLSYAELARRLGMPKSVRAVASACARNRIAVLIPCHRVLRGDGGLGGYRWGLERKTALLSSEHERAKQRAS